MASSILHWVARKAAANSPNYSLITSPDYSLLRGVINGGRCAAPRVVSNGTLKSRRISSPLLMLPPEADHIELVSSSHGWLTFRVDCVSKVITSCSSEQEDCRVMMSFGLHDDDHPIQRIYQDFVYSSRHNCFYCITNYACFDAWDLKDTGCSMYRVIDPPYVDDENYPWAALSEKEMELKKLCTPHIYLVVDEDSGDIFWVRRHVMTCMALYGSYVDINSDDIGYATSLPQKTIGFDVHKYEPEKCAWVYMDGGSLDGLAFLSVTIIHLHSPRVSSLN
ncbi:hypothetical protein OROHE_019534 [Orobanche hederae]